MARLCGFSIEDDDNKKSKDVVSPVPQNNEDGVDHYLTSGFFGSYVDIEGVYKTEFDLIRRYREMSLHPEVDSAIEVIVNEAIVSDSNDTPVEIELSNLNASDGIKAKIREEFKNILMPGVEHMRHTFLPEHKFVKGQPDTGSELADDLEVIAKKLGGENIAACIVEPIAGSTGTLIPPKDYLQ